MLRRSKAAGLERSRTVRFEYRRRYRLTENDPRYLDTTLEEILTDNWAHTYFDDPKLAEEVVDEDFDVNDVARQIGVEIPPDASDDWEELG